VQRGTITNVLETIEEEREYESNSTQKVERIKRSITVAPVSLRANQIDQN